MEIRGSEFAKAQTEMFRKSAIPSMMKMLNDCQKSKKRNLKS